MVRIDAHGRVVRFNGSATGLLGYSPEELIGREYLQLVRPDYRGAARRFYRQQFVRHQPSTYLEFPAIAKNGREVWLGQHVRLVTVEERVTGFDAVARDISSQEQAQQERETTFQMMFASNPHPMWVYDSDTLRFLEVNRAAVAQYGYTRQEFLELQITDIRPPDEAGRLLASRSEMPQPVRHAGIWRHLRKDGGVILAEITTHEIWFGGRQCVLVLANDVTDRERSAEALRSSERRFRALIEQSSEGICLIDGEGRICYEGPTVSRILGFDPEERIGELAREFVQPSDAEVLLARVEEIKTAKARVSAEFRIQRRQGDYRWVEATATNLLHDPSVGAIVVNYRDITRRKQNEEALRRQALLFSQVMDGVYITDLAGEIVDWNPAAEEIFGYKREEVLGKHIRLLDVPEESEDLTNAILAGLAKEGRWKGECHFVRKDGAVGVRDTVIVVLRSATGEPLGALTANRDITERHRTARSLKEAHELLRTITDAVPLALWMLNLEGRVRFWNPAAADLFGWSEAEVTGKPLPIIPPDQQRDFTSLLERYRAGEAVHDLERIRQRKDGSSLPIRLWAAPLRDAQDSVYGVVEVGADMRERIALEAQLRHAQKMEAVGQLAGGIAHDFNNILTVISGHTKMMLAGLDPSDRTRENATEILHAADKAAALTSQILAFSRRQVLQPQVVNLNTIVVSMEKLIRRLIGDHIELVTKMSPALPLLRADPSQLEQVLLNLVVNARDAMSAGGKLTIATGIEAGGTAVALTVADTGCGMDAATAARIFEPFFTTKEQGKGTGLGLATVYGIVTQSGGRVMVETAPNAGATFHILLPADAAERPIAPPPKWIEESPGAGTILVVEDETAVRRMVCEMVRRMGYNVLEASGPDPARTVCSNYPDAIDLLLTDVVMPKMNGYQLAEELSRVRPDMRRLFMSGYAHDALTEAGTVQPSASFLQKPFTTEALEKKIRELLTSQRRSAP
jgi:two-component system cell cycle sensor histidine kinase/response regulator CckA